MDYKQAKANKQVKKEVGGGVNAAMAPEGEFVDSFENVSNDMLIQMATQDSVSKAVVSMLNVLKGTATPAERIFSNEVLNASGVLISFEPMKPKTQPKKKSFLKKLFSKKPKVKTVTKKYTDEQIEQKLKIYFKSPFFIETFIHDKFMRERVMQDAEKYRHELKDAFDAIYTEIQDPKELIKLIKYRFKVTMLDDDIPWEKFIQSKAVEHQQYVHDVVEIIKGRGYKRKAWNAEALKSVYRAFIHIPSGHLKFIDALIHTSDKNPTSRSFYSINDVNYESGEEHDTFQLNEDKSNANDRKLGLEMLPFNTVHELGHIVDRRNNYLSAKGKEMRKVSKWIEIPNHPDVILQQMEENIEGALYDGKLNDEELKIAHECARSFLSDAIMSGASNWDNVKLNAEDWVSDAIKKLGTVPAEAQEEVTLKIVEVLSDNMMDSNVLYHCWRGCGSSHATYHFEDQIRGMKAPLHQGYTTQPWYSFDKNMWSDKISAYQYRDPGEEFAETYASYHAAPSVGKKKGELTPKPLLEWFLKEGLDKASPSKVKGDAKKDDKK